MENYENEIIKRVNVGVALLRYEYTTTEGRFNSKKYIKALENFHKTINELKIPPTEEFLIIGIEHLHELDEEHQKMIKEIKEKIDELDIEQLPKFLKAFKEFAQNPDNKQ